MQAQERVFVIVADVLVEGVVFGVRDLAFAAGPEGLNGVEMRAI